MVYLYNNQGGARPTPFCTTCGPSDEKGTIPMKRSAFTLVELLVVIAIIALLMAILMPALRLARDQAHAIRCVANLRSLTTAWLLWLEDYDAYMVGGHVGEKLGSNLVDWVDTPTGGAAASIDEKKNAIIRAPFFKYAKNVNLYRCPADRRKNRPGQFAFRSYSISGNMMGEERQSGWTRRPLWKSTEILTPATKYVFLEEIDPRGYNMGSWVVHETGNNWIDPLAIWHNKRSCFSFADGRAEKHQWVDQSTMDAAARAAEGDTSVFGFGIRSGEGKDLRFMQESYQLWPTTRPWTPTIVKWPP
jgi:prepilin-type N-terminal cleavage/methylation domain-containing protein